MGEIRHLRMKTKASKIRSMHPYSIIDILINRRRPCHFIGPQREMPKKESTLPKNMQGKGNQTLQSFS